MQSPAMLHGQHTWSQCQRLQQCQQRAACAGVHRRRSSRAARIVAQAAEAMQVSNALGRATEHSSIQHGSQEACHLTATCAVCMQLDEERIKEVRQEATRRIKALGEANKVREAIRELAGLSKLGVQVGCHRGIASGFVPVHMHTHAMAADPRLTPCMSPCQRPAPLDA